MLARLEALVTQTLAAPEWSDDAERITAERFVESATRHHDWELAANSAGVPDDVPLSDYMKRAAVQRLVSGSATRRIEELAERMAQIRNEAAALAEPTPKGKGGLHIVTAASWAGVTPPQRPWIVEGWLPSRALTLFAGDGGTGKSLVVQQLLSAISVGVPFMGVRAVKPVRALYMNCEDDADELHRRQVAIATALDRQLHTFGAEMMITPRLGAPDNALGSFEPATGRFSPSPLYEDLRRDCSELGVRVLALDNVAHLYAGNENVRGEVTAFLNALSRLALEIDGAVILVGHPAKAEGSQYSGSTAWENAVRNRLYLRRPSNDEGDMADNRRILVRSKSNLASIGDQIVMAWHEGAFYPPTTVEAVHGREAEAETVYLTCLDTATAQQRNVSHATGANYAPKVFSAMPESKGIGKKALVAAQERLFSDGTIVANQSLWFNARSRRQVNGIARVTAE
jgi:RecA-family ATPase